MGTFSKTSLEELRSRIDLVEVLSSHVKLQRAGASFKALCPFHDEKTPSFVIQRGDHHYHCFGCGAHGDAIQFLMTYLKMSFVEAIESLAERFHVQLEEVEFEPEKKGPPKALLKDALEKATQFYHFYLLHTPEGHAALEYLYERGITLDFIRQFQIGLSPKAFDVFFNFMQEQRIPFPLLEEVGLITKKRPFFSQRVMIPIRDAMGSTIGFSARKYLESTFGGKYINSPETYLFKKSKALFGLSFSRKTIAKEKKALIVEGQFDALRLIYLGFDWTVASQGTAFTEDHVKELVQLGIRQAYLALDGDQAGKEASVKVGNLFQKEGIDVQVIALPENSDPDTFLREKGPFEWQKLLEKGVDYLTFLVEHTKALLPMNSPAAKNELVQTLSKQIRSWDHPLMVHESLRKLARLTQTPESMLPALEHEPVQLYVPKSASVTFTEIDPDRILEADFLRWLFLMGDSVPEIIAIAKENIFLEHFKVNAAKALYEKYLLSLEEESKDLLSLAANLETPDQQLFLAELLQKKINLERTLPQFKETVQKMLERHWMNQRETIKLEIFSGKHTEEEVLELARKFDELKRKRPEIKL